MYQMNFSQPAKVHFIGIGGISMSGLAELLLDRGFAVSGSDSHESALTGRLREKGAEVMIGQRAENVKEDVDVVVYTAAVHPDNPEYQEAERRNLPILSRAELLGQIMRNYRQAVAIAGTHGKTTTTSMISEICLTAGVDPTITVGGMLPAIGGNIRIGGPDCFIAEACEYTNSFLQFAPTIGVILNIRADHLDFFKDLDDIRHSFRRFAELLPADGCLVISGEIENLSEITEGLPCKIVTFGLDGDVDYQAVNIRYDEMACGRFEVLRKRESLGEFAVSVPGEHNVKNALAAIAACEELGLKPDRIRDGLVKYTGVGRRFEKKGERDGVRIYDDYAHHPDEITATLTMARNIQKNKLWCIFQPHTYSRTKALLPEFAEALSLADEVVLADIYAARETDTLGVSSEDIAVLLREKGVPARFLKTFEEIEKYVLANCKAGDLLITMGAGDIVKVGENLLLR